MADNEKPGKKNGRSWDRPARILTSLVQRNLRIAVGTRAEKWIPPGSPFRSATAERVFDVIKNEVEDWASQKGGAWKIVVEELLIDALDKGLAANVFGRGEQQVEDRNFSPAEQVLQEWWGKAVKAIVDADAAGQDPDAEAKRQLQKFNAVKRAIGRLEAKRKETESVESPEVERKPIDMKKRLYGTKKKPGPVPKAKEKAHRTDVRVAWTLRGVNHRLESWLEERGA